MHDVHHPPPKGQPPDLATALRCIRAFIEAGDALLEAWHPKLDRPSYPRYLISFDEFLTDLGIWEDEVTELAEVSARKVTPLDLSEPDQVRRWLDDLEMQISDAISVGDDATRPLSRRLLGRPMARKQLMESRRALRQLIDAAERGMERPGSG
jgi:hypothetical protein